MKNRALIPYAMTGLAFALAAPSVPAQETERGRALYETNCDGCHYERVHERQRTKITSLSSLRDEVARWAPHARRRLSLDEREELVQYLNEYHYRIGLGPAGAVNSPR